MGKVIIFIDADLELTELASLARIYGESGYTDVDIYEYLDKSLANRVHQMNEQDVSNTLIGFINPEIEQEFEIIQNLEDQVQEIMPKLSLHNVTTLLLRYGQLRKGSKVMVESCLGRVEQIYSSEISSPHDISPIELIMTLYSYNLVGAEAKSYYPVLKSIIANREKVDFDRLQEIYSMLIKFQDDDKFLETLIEVRYEIEKYDHEGNKKPIYE